MYNHTELKDLVEKTIANISYSTEAENLIDPVRYILSIGGKRLRPVLTLMACNLFSDNINEAILPATGLEVFHNFTLVHDDIMDQAPVRRSLPTVHSKWDVNQAVLSGDVMAFIANECFLHAPERCLLKVFRVYNQAAIEVCIGQQLDIDFENVKVISQDKYLRMIELKTSVLIAASLKIGAIIGGASDEDADQIYEFGRNMGVAFQIQDDLLDIYGDANVFGKIHGGDIIANKKTFLFVKALELASEEQAEKLQKIFSPSENDNQKVKRVMELYDQLNIRTVTENLANEYINRAFFILESISVHNERKKELQNIVSSLIGRNR